MRNRNQQRIQRFISQPLALCHYIKKAIIKKLSIPIELIWISSAHHLCVHKGCFFFFLAEHMNKQITSLRSQKELNVKAAGETSRCTQPPVPAPGLGKEEPKTPFPPLCRLQAPVTHLQLALLLMGLHTKAVCWAFGQKLIHLNK